MGTTQAKLDAGAQALHIQAASFAANFCVLMATSSIVVTCGFGALGSAIGSAIGGAAAEAGARECRIGHGAAPEAATLPANMLRLGVDLTDTQAANAALQRAAQALCVIAALDHVAGGFQWQPATGDAFDAWDRMYSMNLKTAVVATRAALPWRRARGGARIFNVVRDGGAVGNRGHGRPCGLQGRRAQAHRSAGGRHCRGAAGDAGPQDSRLIFSG